MHFIQYYQHLNVSSHPGGLVCGRSGFEPRSGQIKDWTIDDCCWHVPG